MTVLLTEGGSFFFLTVAVSSLKVLQPECEVKKTVYKKFCLMEGHHPVLLLQMRCVWVSFSFCGFWHRQAEVASLCFT